MCCFSFIIHQTITYLQQFLGVNLFIQTWKFNGMSLLTEIEKKNKIFFAHSIERSIWRVNKQFASTQTNTHILTRSIYQNRYFCFLITVPSNFDQEWERKSGKICSYHKQVSIMNRAFAKNNNSYRQPRYVSYSPFSFFHNFSLCF